MPQDEKWEIHKVFLHFPSFAWEQNPSLPALADLIRASQNFYVRIAEKFLSEKYKMGGDYHMEVLTRTFEEELREKMIQAKKECKYNPTRFNQMLAQYGGVETARRLIASAQKTGNLSEGLSTLWSCGRLDLSMEESVCKPEYAALFSETEIMYCKNILRELGC